MGVTLEDSPNVGFIVNHNSNSYFVVEVNSNKHLDKLSIVLKESVFDKLIESFCLWGSVFRYYGTFCAPNLDGLRNQVLEEAYGSRYSIYSCSTQMYHELRGLLGGIV